MIFNTKTVDYTNRNEMIAFLTNHFRYSTMNSWNQMTSYANNVKLHNLLITMTMLIISYMIFDFFMLNVLITMTMLIISYMIFELKQAILQVLTAEAAVISLCMKPNLTKRAVVSL